MKLTIIDNRAKCKLCGDIITSTHRHDFVRCKCGEIFVDGGKSYTRCGAGDFKNFISMTVYADEDGNEYTYEEVLKLPRTVLVP